MKNLKINEDWEREALKDFIYLHEQEQDQIERQPALITIVDKDKILEKTHEHQQLNILPF